MLTKTPERHASGRVTPGRNFPVDVLDYYQSLLRRLGWPSKSTAAGLRTLGVTSASRGEGTTTVAVHLAAAAASHGDCRVLLVDANLVRPAAHRLLEVDMAPGLGDFLIDDPELSQALCSPRVADVFGVDDASLDSAVQASPVANLDVLAAGVPSSGAGWAFDAEDLVHIVEFLEQRFGLVVFDMPAAGEPSSMTRLAELLDGVLLVVDAERMAGQATRQTIRALQDADVKLVGSVLNKRRGGAPRRSI